MGAVHGRSAAGRMPTSLGDQASNITHHRGVSQGEDGVGPGGDEFVGDVVVVADLLEGLHDGGVVDFLVLVELAAAGIAGGVDVADGVFVEAEAADEIAVHDADVVDVKEELEVGARRKSPRHRQSSRGGLSWGGSCRGS